MEQNTNQEKQTPTAPKKGMSDFRKALLWTAVPLLILSVASMTGVVVSSDEGSALGFGFLWLGAVLYFLGAIIAVIVFAVMREKQRAAGVLAGLAIGIVSLGATCFAMMSTSSYY